MLLKILKFILIVVIQVAGAIIISILDKKTKLKSLNYWYRQLFIGIFFGLLSVVGSEIGVPITDAIVNVRDAAPITAGLIFGAPAGIIAGLIGGLERFFAVYWGAGTYSRLACSISTILAGLFAAFFRVFMFENKRCNTRHAVVIACGMEVLHMLILFITKLNDIDRAFVVIKAAIEPMLFFNGLSVCLSFFAYKRVTFGKILAKKEEKTINSRFSQALIACIVFAFFLTAVFTYTIQDKRAINDAKDLLQVNIEDLTQKVKKEANEKIKLVNIEVCQELEELQKKGDITYDQLVALANKYGLYEICFIGADGKIKIANIRAHYIPEGFDMASGDQSKEFLVLLNDTYSYIQDFQLMTFDNITWIKYSGIQFTCNQFGENKKGFVQIGYNSSQFHKFMNEFVEGSAVYRHIGNEGFLIVCNEKNVVESDYSGNSGVKLSTYGFIVEEGTEEFSLQKATINGVECYYEYTTVEGYKVIAAIPVSEVNVNRDLSLYITLFMEFFVFYILFIFVYFLNTHSIVYNVEKINRKLADITSGNLDVVVEVNDTVEFRSLSSGINNTVDTLKHYIAEAAARIDKELEFAKNIQASALPSVFPPFPTRTEFDIYASMDTAKEVGGDFYDFFFVGGNKIAYLIADVSGKGIPAAMFMMQSKTLIKSLAEARLEPNVVLTKANERLCEGNDAGMFVTALFCLLDLKTGKLHLVNCGHNPALIRRANGDFEYLKVKAGFVLAGIEDFKYKDTEIDFNPGDEMFLYTDGVTEATNANNELYGEDRLLKCLNDNKGLSVEEICKKVKASVDSFVGEADQFDDITMMSFKFNHLSEANNAKEIILDAKVENIDVVTDFINKELEAKECSMKAQTQIDVAIDEIFNNISNYAYSGKTGEAKVSISFNGDMATISFSDYGVPFNPLMRDDPDVTLSAEDRNIGGLGIFIVKQTMDDVDYIYQDGANILTIKKRIK